jgi:RimJ/RimL family protein N-acetyltransferase
MTPKVPAASFVLVSDDGVEIVAGGLLLRPWREADSGAVYRACQDPEIQRWTRVPSPYLPEHARQLTTEVSPSAWATGSGAPLGVFDAATGELLGASGLVHIGGGTGEVGYWTAPWARGRGVAGTALRATVTFAFEALPVDRIAWHAALGNHASRLVALRAGVRVGGRIRVSGRNPGETVEAWTGSLLAGEVPAETPDRYAPGSPAALRAAVFGGAQPTLPGRGPLGDLGPMRDDELDEITAACQDPDSARWTTVPVPYARADAEFYARRHAPLTWAAGEGAVFRIADRRGRYAGNIDLRIQEQDDDTAEVGFLVAPWARGQGLGTAALRAICDWGFDALRLTRIVWRAHLGNEASRRAAEKAGFVVEGVQRAGCVQRGERRDAWVGARLATDPS